MAHELDNRDPEKNAIVEPSKPLDQEGITPNNDEKQFYDPAYKERVTAIADGGKPSQNADSQESLSATVVDEPERGLNADYKDPGPPPDGGWVAWTQALMAHLIIFNTWGFVNSFGVFQSYYTTTLDRSPSDVSWIGSLQIFLLFAVGTFSGRALDAGLFRIVLFAGCLTLVFGMFMTSLCTQYWQFILAQGICVGIGNGLLFCPCISLVSTYFSKNKSLAMGFAAAGSATGGIVYPIIVQQLLPKIGFGWTVRVLAFVTLASTALANIFMRTRIPPRKSGPLIELAAFKEPPYVLYCIATFLNFWGLYFAFFYIGAFARDVIKLSYSKSIDLVIIINAVGYVGRIVPALLADRYIGAVNAITPCAFLAGILLYAWSGVHDESSLIAFCVIYGLFSSGVQSMFAVALASLTQDLSKAGTRMGMCFTIVSFAVLTGEPIAGAMISERGGDYLVAQMWGGTIVVTSALVLVAARLSKTGFVLKAKV